VLQFGRGCVDREDDVISEVGVTAQRRLLLLHQIPTKPAYFRVKIWRRLNAIGAVAIKGAVYALPAGDQSREDFEWLLKEIIEGGGEAMIWEATLLAGMSDQEVRELFNAARDDEYTDIIKVVRKLDAALVAMPSANVSEAAAQLKRLMSRRDTIVAIDFFGANGREAADGILEALEARLSTLEIAVQEGVVDGRQKEAPMSMSLKGRTWVTRQDVHVDRIASAWLIRRYIDSEAQFKFVQAKNYTLLADELRFDMFEAEFTHEGDMCTFEVLLSRFALREPALVAIGQVVHDIDLKDNKFGREETAGIKALIAGVCVSTSSDEERLTRGGAVFDVLFESFRKPRA